MIRQSKTTLKELTAQYRSILKKCALLNTVAIIGFTFGANADYIGGKFINTNTTLSDENVASQAFTIDDNTTERGGVDGANPGYGGYAFANRGSELTVKNSIYQNNTFDGQGGIFSTRTPKEGKDAKLTIEDSQFLGNSATREGAAIANYNIAVIKNSTFKDNKANPGEFKSDYKNTEVGGGAIALGSEATTTIEDSVFQGNESGVNGGAIKTKAGTMDSEAYNDRQGSQNNNSAALLSIADSTFDGNKAQYLGGALFNTFYHGTSVTDETGVIVSNSIFNKNEAQNGGAIYNDGTTDRNDKGGVMTINDSTFTGNKALFSVADASTYKKEGVGGAIASSGILTVNNSTFTGNTALSTGTGYGLGGALSTVTVDGLATSMDVNGSIFTGNKADVGGAIYGMLYDTHKQDYSTIAIENSVFNKNEAKYTGSAIANFDAMTITNSDFSGNKVFENVAGETDGGTLFLGSDSKTSVVGSSFNNNSSATVGGAIATRTFGDNSQAKLDITNTTFEGNIATTNGGAIDNYFYHSNTNANGVTIADSAFTANQAANGGAIYNHSEGGQSGKILLTNINFEENIAMTKGGAIYNDGTMTFKGHALFSGNTANGELNDIHNDGNIIFWGDANITLDGGISGAGFIQFSDKTTLNAKLNTTTILADTVQFDGNNIINLTVENGLDNGDYKFISGSIEGKDETTISENSLYNLSWSETTDGYITLAKKTTSEVVAGLAKEGVNAQQAAAISAFADSTAGNPILSSITEAVQSGKAKAATKLVEEIAPTTSQTVMGVAQEVNNILNNVAGVRMAAVGRSGGDAFVGGSVWAQGLMNHTKQNSTDNNAGFSADTAGVSFGIDGKITNDLMIGIGYGYTNTNADSGSRDIDVDGHNIFAYTEYKPNNWYINGMFSYGINKYEETKIANLGAKYDVNTYAANVMTGYDFDSGVTPEIGVRYLLADQKSYNDGLQNISADNNDVLTGVAGFKYKADMKANNWTFAPNLRLAATYDMISDDSIANVSVIGGGNYQITGESLERLGVEAGIGLETTYKDWTFSIDYNGGFRKDFQSHTGMLKAKYNF